MASVQNDIVRALDKLHASRLVILSALGLGFCRACLGWILTATRICWEPFGIPVAAPYFIGLAELLGFLSVSKYAAQHVQIRDCPVFFLYPLFAIPLGACLASLVHVAYNSSILTSISFVLSCFFIPSGYAVLLITWIEFLSTLAPRKAISSFALAYFVNLFIWLACREMSWTLSLATCILSALLSSVLLVDVYQNSSFIQVPELIFPKRLISIRLLLWVCVFSLAYGIGDSITSMGYSTIFSKIGMALPELVVLLCLMFAPSRFEINVFYRLTFVLMTIGLMGVFFSDMNLGFAQLMMSAANECFQLFALMVACFITFRRGSSAALYCGLIMSCSTVFSRLGYLCGNALADQAEAFYIAALILVILFGTLLLRENHFDEQLHLDMQPEPDESSYIALAREKGLSNREKSVYLLLIRGDTYEEIAESLFIAPSTVRAHASHIYEKFGCHVRSEFDEIVKAETAKGLIV